MTIADFNHIKDVLEKLDTERPSRFGYTEAAVNATGTAELDALEGVFIMEDSTQINSIPTPDLLGVDPIIVNIGLRTQAATMSRMAMSHFFGRLGLNLLKITEKIRLLVDNHLVNRYITPSGDVMEDVTAGYTADTITLVKHKSPLSASAPISSSSAISLLAAVYDGNAGVMTGADKKKLDDVDGAAVKLTGNQTVAGIKTFSSIPMLPASDPTTDNQAARKAYVDIKVQSIEMPIVDINSDTALTENTVYILDAAVIKTLTLPATALKGDTIKIIDKGGKLFRIKRNDHTVQTLMNKSLSLIPSSINEYLKSVSIYSVADLICLEDNNMWIEQNLSDIMALSGKGYHMGGDANSVGSYTAVIEDINFTDETSVPISATLDAAKCGGCGVSGPLKGYCMGGTSSYSTNTASIENLDFASEVSASIAATLNTTKRGGSGVSSTTKGYLVGGSGAGAYDSSSVLYNIIEDMKFSDETSVPIVATIVTARAFSYGISSILKGYLLGGGTGLLNNNTNSIESLVFSDDTVTTVAATLSAAKRYGASSTNGSTKGYAMGGSTSLINGTALSTIESITFDQETITVISAILNIARVAPTGISGGRKGYSIGGYNSAGSASYNSIEGINFSSETSDILTATLNTSKGLGIGVQGIV